MTDIRFHNTLTNRLEALAPVHPGEVRIYTCGPTVYDFAHIGNFRTFVFQDILRRFLRSRGLRVLQVMNLTDVDDRIIQKAALAGVSIREYTEKYVEAFLEDMRALNLEMPEEIVRATDHIEDMVSLIERLQQKGITYPSEGSIYYRISKFPDYVGIRYAAHGLTRVQLMELAMRAQYVAADAHVQTNRVAERQMS